MALKRKSSGRMASKGFPNPIDVHVGKRLRLRRTLLGMSQTGLGEAIGLTFQQVQKYERGTNRVSSSRLFDMSRVLDVPLKYFFDEMADDIGTQSPGQLLGAKPTQTEEAQDPSMRRETLELVRVYYRIGDQTVRKRFTDLVRSLGSGAEAGDAPRADGKPKQTTRAKAAALQNQAPKRNGSARPA
jgi:transcriptional regulator with XRE-family HTH domain